MLKKTLIAAVAVTTIGAGALLSQTDKVQAADTTKPMSGLVAKIATKFGLNQAEVQAVFDEVHQEHEAQMKAEYEARLTQLVTDGKITAAQRQLILGKHQELMANRETKRQEMANKTDEERRAAMEADRQALKAWAEQNGIDPQYLNFIKFKGTGGPGKRMEMRSLSSPTPATPPAP